jgi:WD40 repeat protein
MVIPETVASETSLYFGRFDRKWGKYILTGGSSPNQAKIVDISNKLFVSFQDFERELYCGEWNSDNSMICLGGDDGTIRLFEVNL